MFEEGFENKVYNCDCRDLMKEMIDKGIKADCIITDPPYLIDYKTNYRKNKDHKFCSVIENDNNPDLIVKIMPMLYEVLKNDSPIYMFCNSDKIDFFKKEVEKYFNIKNIIVWDKGNWTAGDLEAQFGKQYEFIIYANKGRAKFKIDKRLTDIWRISRCVGDNQIHQNQKPEDLISRIINIHTNENDLILDPFMGSFTTAVCCHKLNRRYIGCELDEEYYKLGTQRLFEIQNQISLFD